MEQELKPFNLERALAGDQVVTRDGREVKDVRHLPSCWDSQKVIGCINGYVYLYYEDGTMSNHGPQTADLFMKPAETDYWVVTYHGLASAEMFTELKMSEDDANKWIKRHDRVALTAQVHKITRIE